MTSITRIGDYHVGVVGLANVVILDPEETLRLLRAKLPESDIQVLRADRIAGREHVEQALQNAFKAVGSREQRSRSISMETLLYVSGERQISRALLRVGIRRGVKEVVVLIFSRKPRSSIELEAAAKSVLNGNIHDSVIDISTKKKLTEICREYDISDRELLASGLPGEDATSLVKRLVLERSALLSIQK